MSSNEIVLVIDMLLKALSARILVFVALAMTFGLFCWAMWAGGWPAIATASIFGFTIFLPVLVRSIRSGTDVGQSG